MFRYAKHNWKYPNGDTTKFDDDAFNHVLHDALNVITKVVVNDAINIFVNANALLAIPRRNCRI